jgi:hypothetical protein
MAEAQHLLVEPRVIAVDESGLLQGADPAQAGRRRYSDASGQLDIGHAAFRLELLENEPVRGVETDPQQQRFLLGRRIGAIAHVWRQADVALSSVELGHLHIMSELRHKCKKKTVWTRYYYPLAAVSNSFKEVRPEWSETRGRSGDRAFLSRRVLNGFPRRS